METEAKPAAVVDETKATFLPTRFIHRETEHLARRFDDAKDAEAHSAKVGDWLVIDDRGQARVIADGEFTYFFQEHDGDNWPGKIHVTLPGGLNALGCRMKHFKESGEVLVADAINAFFAAPENFGMTLVDKHFFSPYEAVIFYTTNMSDRARREFSEVHSEVRAAIDERHRKALEGQAKAVEGAYESERKAKLEAELEKRELEALAHDGIKWRKYKGERGMSADEWAKVVQDANNWRAMNSLAQTDAVG